jgi:hypothetical protein
MPKINLLPPCLRTCLVICISGLCSATSAQQVVWAQKNNLDKKTDFTKVIGQNKHGVYVLKHKNSTLRRYFIIQKFDRKMNLLRSKTIKIPNSELKTIIVLENDIIFFTRFNEKNYTNSLYMQHLDTSLNADLPQPVFNNCDLPGSFPDFRIEYSENKKKVVAWYISENENNNLASIHLQLIEKDRKADMQLVELNEKVGDIDIREALTDPEGNFYCLMNTSRNFKSNKAYDFKNRILCVNIHSGKSRNETFHPLDTFISNADLSFNSSSGRVHATGFYGSKDEDDDKGYFDIAINPADFNFEHAVFRRIDRKTVAKIISIKFEQRGENLNKFSIRKIIPKTDGGCIVISERSYVTTQSDVFYVNGMPQTSYAKVWYNDELLILSLDSLGNLVWDDAVLKSQSSVNDGGYYNGIIVMVNDENFNIIYNDRLSANADVIQITYQENGQHSKKILLNSDQYYALVIPGEYKQVTANSIVLPVNQNRDYTYIKLLY